MKELRLEAAVNNLDKVIGFIDKELENADCPLKVQIQIDVAVEELFVNVANYAYGDKTGDVTVRFELEDGGAAVTFIDGGVPYDPLKKEDPDFSLPVERRPIGGLGIYMVKKSMDKIDYEYRDGCNILTVHKRFS